MSARNCKPCHNCESNWASNRTEKLSDIKALYGRVTPEVYESQMDEYRKNDKPPEGETLGEYYEHWFDGGKFHTYYNCHCDVCGFSFDMPIIEIDA